MIKTSISLDEELLKKVKTHAKRHGKTISGMIRVGLESQITGDIT